MQGASTAMYKDLNVQGDTLVMKYHDWKLQQKENLF